MGVGEAPGQWEDNLKRPFVGDAGQELDKLYLRLAGLERREVFITNTMKCRPPNNRKPTVKEIRECSRHFLPEELEQAAPEVVVLMGATACSLVPSISLERDHGIPLQGTLFGHPCILFPTFHPAAGLRGGKVKSVNVMTYLLEDFTALGSLLKGTLRPKIDPWAARRHQILTSGAEVRRALSGRLVTPDLAIDTESHNGVVPWSVQFSTHPAEAYFIRATSREACRELGRAIPHFRVLLHNGIADLDPLEAMGAAVEDFTDTMHLAYHTGRLPQGLKALAWRLLGARMRDYDDVVMPWSREALLKWIEGNAWRFRATEKLSEETRALRRIWRNTAKDQGEKPYDPWEKWEELPDAVARQIADVAGPHPQPGIAHVPLAEAVEYACEDARRTLLVGWALEKRLDGMGAEVVESDWAQ